MDDQTKGPSVKMGLDVSLTSEKMERDAWADKMLRDIGETLSKKECGLGMTYVGSFAFHLMIEKSDIQKPTKRISSITQIAIDDISEQVAALAFNNGQVALRKYFNPALKLGKRGDKR